MPLSWLTGSKERLCGDLNLLGERASLPHQDIGRNMRLSVACSFSVLSMSQRHPAFRFSPTQILG